MGRRRVCPPAAVAVLAAAAVMAAVAAAAPAAAAEPPPHDAKAGGADAHAGEFDYYREWGDDHLAAAHPPDGDEAGAKAIHDDFETFVGGVESVMGDQRAAGSKREVVDLGQSLHLLDSKFEHLKESLYEQLATASARRKGKGASAAVAEGHALAQKVKRRYTAVRSVAREVLELMATNARAVDNVGETIAGLEKGVVELQRGLERHHKDMTELGSSVKRLHDSSHGLMQTHASASDSALSAAAKASAALRTGSLPAATQIYYLLLAELAGLCAFYLFRRQRSRVKYSAKLF